MLLSITFHLKVYYNSVCHSQAQLILTMGSFYRVTNRNTATGFCKIHYSQVDGKMLIEGKNKGVLSDYKGTVGRKHFKLSKFHYFTSFLVQLSCC